MQWITVTDYRYLTVEKMNSIKIIFVSIRGEKGVVESLNLAYDFVKTEEEKGEVLQSQLVTTS